MMISNPNYRSRWVGRDFKGNDKDRDDLFAGTPPLEAKKLLISCAASQLGKPLNKQKRLSFIDIKKKLTFYFVPRIILDHFSYPKSIFRYPTGAVL